MIQLLLQHKTNMLCFYQSTFGILSTFVNELTMNNCPTNSIIALPMTSASTACGQFAKPYVLPVCIPKNVVEYPPTVIVALDAGVVLFAVVTGFASSHAAKDLLRLINDKMNEIACQIVKKKTKIHIKNLLSLIILSFAYKQKT